jgi:hypothetical protein
VIAAVSIRCRDASAECLLLWSSMTGSEHLGRQVRVESRPLLDRRRSAACRPWRPQLNRFMSEYPTSDELLACLYTLAGVAETEMQKPFRVDMIRTHGKPPMYSVVIRAAEREPILTRIGQIIHRSFALGASSFMLTSSETEALLKHGQRR